MAVGYQPHSSTGARPSPGVIDQHKTLSAFFFFFFFFLSFFFSLLPIFFSLSFFLFSFFVLVFFLFVYWFSILAGEERKDIKLNGEGQEGIEGGKEYVYNYIV